LQSAKQDDAGDLVALGTDHSVEIILIGERAVKSVASFHIGSRITALAFSPRTVSPSCSDDWLIEFVVYFSSLALELLERRSPSQTHCCQCRLGAPPPLKTS